jgi:hypothetical protein
MDTDDFSQMARGIIARAARVSDTLKAELGALSARFSTEDEWLQGIRKHLCEIVQDPDEYVESWSLEESEGVDPKTIRNLAGKLGSQVDRVLAVPLSERGQPLG